MESSLKLLFCRNQDQRKHKEQENMLKRLKAYDTRYVETLQFKSRQQKRRFPEETTEHCRVIQNIVAIIIQNECQAQMS